MIDLIKIDSLHDERVDLIFNELIKYYELPYTDIYSVCRNKGKYLKQKEFKLSFISALLEFTNIIPSRLSEQLGWDRQNVFSYARDLKNLNPNIMDDVIISNRNDFLNNKIRDKLIEYQSTHIIQTKPINTMLTKEEVKKCLSLQSRKGKRSVEDKELLKRFDAWKEDNKEQYEIIKNLPQSEIQSETQTNENNNNLTDNKMENSNPMEKDNIVVKSPLEAEVIVRDYAGEIHGADVTTPSELAEPSFTPESTSFDMPDDNTMPSGDNNNSVSENGQPYTDESGMTQEQANPIDPESSEFLADTIIDGYEMAHGMAKYFLEQKESKLIKKDKEGKIDLEAEVETPNGILSTRGLAQSYNEGLEQILTVSPEFKAEVKPILSEILQKKGAGMTPEQRLMFIVGKDVISKGAMIYGMMSEMKANMSYLKDIHAELKKKNMPQPTMFQQQVQQAPQQQYEQQVSQPISKPEPVYQQVQNDPVYSQPSQPVKQAPVQQPIESFVDEFQSNVTIPNPPKIGRKAKEMQKAVQKNKKQVNTPVEKKPTKIQHKKSNIEDLGREYKEVGE